MSKLWPSRLMQPGYRAGSLRADSQSDKIPADDKKLVVECMCRNQNPDDPAPSTVQPHELHQPLSDKLQYDGRRTPHEAARALLPATDARAASTPRCSMRLPFRAIASGQQSRIEVVSSAAFQHGCSGGGWCESARPGPATLERICVT